MTREFNYQNTLAQAQRLWSGGKLEDAWALSERLLPIAPQDPHLLHLRGALLSQTQYKDEGVKLLEQAAKLGPAYWPELYLTLGIVLEELDQLKRAESWLKQAVNSQTTAPQAHYYLGRLYARMGRTKDAQPHFENAATLQPRADIEKASLFNLVALPGVTNQARCQRFQRYAQNYLDPLQHYYQYPNTPDPKRPLKIGFVSGDFRKHVASTNFHALFQHRNQDAFQFYAYAQQQKSDDWTDFFRQESDQWLEIQDHSDEEAAARIYQDQIDILIDCSGISKGGRLGIFARKPAPIQLSAFGFFYTTGMAAIDYQFTDALAVPEACSDWYSESLIYLTSQLHWTPWIDPEGTLPPTQSPFQNTGQITFGCGNAPYKVNPEMIHIWAQILAQLPGSRLLFKYDEYDIPDIQAYFCQRFAEYGVSQSQLEFTGQTSQREHLAFYQQLDIALDPFPYTGGVTTCETLYMGVPVLSLAGECTTISLGILRQLGLTEYIAETPETYIQTAVNLAQNPKQLTRYHQTLRTRLLNSPICQSHAFAQEIYTAFREIWHYWCEEQKEKQV